MVNFQDVIENLLQTLHAQREGTAAVKKQHYQGSGGRTAEVGAEGRGGRMGCNGEM